MAVLLVVVKGLYPERFTGVAPTLAGFGQQLGSETVLRRLREVAAVHLQERPAPVGLRPAGGVGPGVRESRAGAKKHYTGLSPPGGAA